MSNTQNLNGWPDAARETVEWALAVHFSGDRMPHMSGDPRNRLSPGRRRAMEDARDAALEALAPILAEREATARREGIEAAAKWHDDMAARFGGGAPALAAWHLQCAAAVRAPLGDER